MPFFKKNDKKAFELFVNYEESRSLCEILEKVALKFPKLWAITDEYNNIQMTSGQLKKEVDYFAGGLQALGVKKGDFISLFSENHGRWIVADQGILKCGAIEASRGSNAPVDELDYIISHSDSKGLILKDDTTLEELKPYLSNHKLDFIILLFVKNEVSRKVLSCPF
jgi:long-chain acyl-CoA synthetase